MPALALDRVRRALAWADSHVGDAYDFGGNGPHTWDCSSFTQAAYRQIGINMPRTAGAQRDWLAKGNGHRVKPGTERPGDLIFWDSFLGPNQIGHVAMVWDPATKTTIDARNSRVGVGKFSYGPAANTSTKSGGSGTSAQRVDRTQLGAAAFHPDRRGTLDSRGVRTFR